MDEATASLKKYLGTHIAFRQKMMAEDVERTRKLGFTSCCLEDFVLKHGRGFDKAPKPRKYKRGTPKYCYYNSMKLVRRHPNELVYVEGYATIAGFLPTLHGWCVSRKDPRKVIDVTTDNMSAYWGVPFTRETIEARLNDGTDECALLDNWNCNWPMLRATDEELKTLIQTL